MAYVVPYLLGGLTAFLVSEFVPFSSAAGHLSGAMQSEHAGPAQLRGTPGSSVNRASKGNRNAAPRTAVGNPHIATVEVVGLLDTAIVYRGRDGRELFRTDPMNNVTLVTKGLHLPEVTVRQHSSSAVKPVPVRTLHEQNQVRERKPAVPARRKVPVGCEPLFSPVASPSLSHHAGRCMAELDIASGSLG